MKSRANIVAAALLIQGLLLQLAAPLLGQHSHVGLQGSYVHFHDGILERMLSDHDHDHVAQPHLAHGHDHVAHSHPAHGHDHSHQETRRWQHGHHSNNVQQRAEPYLNHALTGHQDWKVEDHSHSIAPILSGVSLFPQPGSLFLPALPALKADHSTGFIPFFPEQLYSFLVHYPPWQFPRDSVRPVDDFSSGDQSRIVTQIARGLIPFRTPPPSC